MSSSRTKGFTFEIWLADDFLVAHPFDAAKHAALELRGLVLERAKLLGARLERVDVGEVLDDALPNGLLGLRKHV